MADTVGALKERWDKLKEKVEENIKKAARTKVEAGFAYEYLRVSAEDTLLDVDLPAEEFRRLHAGLVAGYLKDATDWARENPEALRKYLRQKSIKRAHAWGFTHGDELRDLLDHAVIWRAVAAADAGGIIESLADDIGGTAEASLELTIDDAAPRPLLRAVAAGFDASPTSPGLTRNDVLGTLALGTAMPVREPFAVRRSALVRSTLYAPLWEVYFKDGDDKGTPQDYAKTAGKWLPIIAANNHIDLQGLEGRERQQVSKPDIQTFAGQIVLNGDIDHMDGVHRNWRNFLEGLRRLDAATRPGGCVSYETNAVSDIFDRLQGFWSQALFLRAAGVYLLGLASVTRFPDDPALPKGLRNQLLVKGIKRSLTIKFAGEGEGDEGKTVVYSASV